MSDFPGIIDIDEWDRSLYKTVKNIRMWLESDTPPPVSLIQGLRKTAELEDLFTDVFPNTILTVYDEEFFNKYGDRKLSRFMINYPYVKQMYEQQKAYDIKPIAVLLNGKFGEKWRGLYDSIVKEYDPIKPFNISLDEHHNDSFDVVKDSTTYDDRDKTRGFNSVQDVDTDSSNGTTNHEYNRTTNGDRSYNRVGNIGNRSQSELIMQEREKLMFNLQNIIYEDILSVIARRTYGD